MVWFRISLVLLLLVAAIAATLTIGRGGGPGKPAATKYGVTSQGRAFELRVDRHGRPVSFATELGAMCPSGRMVSMPWSPVDGDGVRFRHAGGKLAVTERSDLWELRLDATVARDGALSGTARLVVHVRPQTRAPYDCSSPRVRVSAGR